MLANMLITTSYPLISPSFWAVAFKRSRGLARVPHIIFTKLLLLTFFSTLASTPTSANPKLEARDCITEGSTGDLFGATCYTLHVAENPDAPSAKLLPLYITRLSALQSTQKPPVFFIAGGPGQAASDLLPLFRQTFSDLLIDHDFVFVDQRGTGHSAPLNCDTDLLPLASLTPEALEKHALQTMKQCIQETEADFRYYTTPYAVADLHHAREALGYTHIFLWGGSYGTRVVLDYMRRHGDTVSGAILDGLAPVSIQLPTFAERDGSHALAALLQLCEDARPCRQAFPQLATRWRQHLTALAENPVTVQLEHPRTQKNHTVYIDDRVLSAWVRLILYSRDIEPILPLALHRASEGDYSLLFSVFSVGLDDMSKGISELMQSAVLCAEDARHAQLQPIEVHNDADLLRMPTRAGFDATCAQFPASELALDYFAPVKSHVPSLLLSGKLDPVTPPLWGEKVQQHLSRSQHLVIDSGHHIVSRLGCVPDIISRFVEAPQTIGNIDTECTAHIAAPHFFIDAAGPAMKKAEGKQ